jgi:putative membrane protein
MWHHGYGWMNGFGGTMWGIGLLFWLVIIAAVVLLVVWAVRSSGRYASTPPSQEPDALEIARRRYARGEISKEQFEQIKRDLAA